MEFKFKFACCQIIRRKRYKNRVCVCVRVCMHVCVFLLCVFEIREGCILQEIIWAGEITSHNNQSHTFKPDTLEQPPIIMLHQWDGLESL